MNAQGIRGADFDTGLAPCARRRVDQRLANASSTVKLNCACLAGVRAAFTRDLTIGKTVIRDRDDGTGWLAWQPEQRATRQRMFRNGHRMASDRGWAHDDLVHPHAKAVTGYDDHRKQGREHER